MFIEPTSGFNSSFAVTVYTGSVLTLSLLDKACEELPVPSSSPEFSNELRCFPFVMGSNSGI